jgi:hypothetical protein
MANNDIFSSKILIMHVKIGMDQGFHNYIIYAGILEKYMDIKIYQHVSFYILFGNYFLCFYLIF